jgi:hypothetical protein
MGQCGGGWADAQVNNMLKVDLKESMDATGSTHFSGLFNVDDDSKSAVSAFKGSAKQPFVIGKWFEFGEGTCKVQVVAVLSPGGGSYTNVVLNKFCLFRCSWWNSLGQDHSV